MNTYDPYDYDDSTAPVAPTNRQVALMAAATVVSTRQERSTYHTVTIAREFLRFLEGEDK